MVHFVAKRYILQQKCLKGQIGTCLLGTGWCNRATFRRVHLWRCAFWQSGSQGWSPTLRARMHSVTDWQTDGHSRSYCVAIRSAKNDYLHSLCNVYKGFFKFLWSSSFTALNFNLHVSYISALHRIYICLLITLDCNLYVPYATLSVKPYSL